MPVMEGNTIIITTIIMLIINSNKTRGARMHLAEDDSHSMGRQTHTMGSQFTQTITGHPARVAQSGKTFGLACALPFGSFFVNSFGSTTKVAGQKGRSLDGDL